MLKRNENDSLQLDQLSLEIFLDNLFAKCQLVREVDWLLSGIVDAADAIAEDRKDKLIRG